MASPGSRRSPGSARKQALANAFQADQFDVHQTVNHQGKIGMLAWHRTAKNAETLEPKRAYYLEGSPREMGVLMGMMAEPVISRMTDEFVDTITMDMVAPTLPGWLKQLLGEIIADVVDDISQSVKGVMPREYLEEMQGLVDGCHAANPNSSVDWDGVWLLNVGADCALAAVYGWEQLLKVKKHRESLRDRLRAAGKPAARLLASLPRIDPTHFRVPFLCNSFSVFGQAAGGGHYFGRDFMFPNAGVYQDAAAMIIRNPDPIAGKQPIPTVSQAAPGMVGSVAGMNVVREGGQVKGGLGIGVNMVAAANVNLKQPGINSLVLVRDAVQYSKSLDDAIARFVSARRGMCWIYPISDGINDQAAVIEAGAKVNHTAFWTYPTTKYQPFLPDRDFLKNHPTAVEQEGLMVRRSDYPTNQGYFGFNPELFRQLGKTYNSSLVGRRAYLSRRSTQTGSISAACPGSYYFAPQREDQGDLVIATNFFVIPEMRLCSMDAWVNQLAEGRMDDFQWRYDELNNRILDILDAHRRITFGAAKDLIDFLSPVASNLRPRYYKGPVGPHSKKVMISGSVSVMDLRAGVVESQFGYYGDGWVTITLPNYLP